MIALWSSRYATGIEAIDRQHRAFFDTINTLHEAFRAGGQELEAAKSLEFILAYSQEHFILEERLMVDNSYPGALEHRAEHATYAAMADQLRSKAAQGGSAAMSVSGLLANWWTGHILQADLTLARFLEKIKEEEATA